MLVAPELIVHENAPEQFSKLAFALPSAVGSVIVWFQSIGV